METPVGIATIFLIDVSPFSPATGFSVELVDSLGLVIAPPQSLQVSAFTVAYACPPLQSGRFYVRLFRDGELQREFAIHAG